MKTEPSVSRFGELSQFWSIAAWPFVLIAAFLPTFGLPSSTVGYLWNVELVFSAFLLIAVLVSTKPQGISQSVSFSWNVELLAIILPIVMFIALSFLSTWWAVNWRNAMHHTLLWACYLLFYILVRNMTERTRLLTVSLKTAGIVMVILGAACVVEYVGSVKPLTFSYTIRWYKYAEALATLLPVFLAISFSRKRRTAILSTAVVVAAWLVVLLSQSRTMLIASSASIIVFFTLAFLFHGWHRTIRRAAVLAALLVTVAGLSQVSFTPTSEEDTTLKRFAGGEDSTLSAKSRLLFWGIALEAFRSHPVLGVGADNYISIYRDGREAFSARYPTSDLLNINENVIPERAHCEYLQILSELGIVGAAFFAWLLGGTAYFFLQIRRKRVSLLSLGSFAGIAAFLISSLSSAYSFRVPANGVCFFFVLALAVGSGRSAPSYGRRSTDVNDGSWRNHTFQRAILACGVIVCTAMIVFSAVRGISLMYLARGLNAEDTSLAFKNIETAVAMDRQDPMIRSYYGMRLYEANRASEAIPQLRFAIDKGIANSVSYFYLYCAQFSTGKDADAAFTLAESLSIYPRSVFLLTAYAHFLKTQHRDTDAVVEYAKAESINPKQARSWMLGHDEGLERLTQVARVDPNYAPTMDLLPVEAPLALANSQRSGQDEH